MGKLIPWKEFQKQLDPVELGAWGVVVGEARRTHMPQYASIGPLRYAVWPSGMIQEVWETCPKCGFKGEMEANVRQYQNLPGVADVGFRCPKCWEEWGFEVGER